MDWNSIGMGMNLDLELDDDGLLDPPFDISQPVLGFSATAPTMPTDYFGSYELIGLGLQEPLPPQDMMDELHTIYFEKYHRTMPMMHKLRYYASLDRAPHMRPPICLRYAMWTVAASLSDKYSSFEAIFYERTRRYLQDAEMKVKPMGNLLLLPLKRYRGTEKRLLLCTTHRLGVSWQLMRLRKLSSHEHG
jgi:hypothetical protein